MGGAVMDGTFIAKWWAVMAKYIRLKYSSRA